MAAVHFGRLVGPAGFARTVAVKRLHPELAEDRDAVAMLIEEARLAAHLHHPNVAATLDVVIDKDSAYVIMDYVHGESLARLLRASKHKGLPKPGVVASILSGALRGLHAAHEARSERGEPLEIIHRDVSPQNVLIGVDGMSRLIDFGIAKARIHTTTLDGRLKGKLSYLAPEQVRGGRATRRTDIYSAGVVLWEALTGRRLFDGDCPGAITEQILLGWIDPPSKHVTEVSEALDRVALRALESDPSRRFSTAEEMAKALELAEPPATIADVGAWVVAIAGDTFAERETLLRAIEESEGSRSRSPARRVAVFAGLAALLSGAPAIALYARSSGHANANAIAAATPAAGHTSAPPAAIAPTQAAISPENPVRAAAPLAEAFGVSVDPLPQTARVPRRSRKVLASTPSPALDCDPPYSATPDGIRIYKRECLRL
jgi:serine/threonine-protein kinase